MRTEHHDEHESDAAAIALIGWIEAQLRAGADPGSLAAALVGLGVDVLCGVTGRDRAIALVHGVLADIPDGPPVH